MQPSQQMLLRSQGPVDQLDTTQLSPAGRYVRSYNINGHCNINASYHTVGLQIKEKRRELVFTIVTILGNDPRSWFASSLRPVALPIRPLDWSTIVLQQLCVFAQSLPCDPRNTSVDERLSVAHQKMLAEASGSPGFDSSINCANMQQMAHRPSWNSNKDHEFNWLHALSDHANGTIRNVGDRLLEVWFYHEANDIHVGTLEEDVKDAITKLSQCLRGLSEVRK